MALRRELLSDILWSLVAVAIVVGGVAGFRVMGALRTPLEASEAARVVPLVETAPLVLHDGPVPVRGEGFVRPFREVSLAAQAPGRIVELHPALLSHGQVEAGETLVRLDDRSARATLARAEADIDATRARIELNATQLERAETLRRRGVISQDELDQRLAQEAELAGTLSSLESARVGAEIALDNTVVLAPFGASVRAREAELGSVVAAGQPIATLFTAERLEVTVPLTERAAALIPDLFAGGGGRARSTASPAASVPSSGDTPAGESVASGASATVTTTFAGRASLHPARVARVARALGTGTRMLDVTVAFVPDAARLADDAPPPPAGTPPALVESYARVAIDGAALEGVHAIASSAVRPGDVVWLVVGDTFAVRDVETVHVDGATSYVRIADLPDDAVLVTGVVDTPVDGMRVATRAAADDGSGEGGGGRVSDAGAIGAPAPGPSAPEPLASPEPLGEGRP